MLDALVLRSGAGRGSSWHGAASSVRRWPWSWRRPERSRVVVEPGRRCTRRPTGDTGLVQGGGQCSSLMLMYKLVMGDVDQRPIDHQSLRGLFCRTRGSPRRRRRGRRKTREVYDYQLCSHRRRRFKWFASPMSITVLSTDRGVGLFADGVGRSCLRDKSLVPLMASICRLCYWLWASSPCPMVCGAKPDRKLTPWTLLLSDQRLVDCDWREYTDARRSMLLKSRR